jgi:Tol biopolymer transport system component
MRNLFFLLVFAILLSACATPQTEQPAPSSGPIESTLPVIPTDTRAPTATEAPTATAEPTVEPTVEPTATPTLVPEPQWLAFIGNDGNLHLVDRISGETRQLTSDAAMMGSGDGLAIQYWNPQWSSDGSLLAYQRDVGTPLDSGYEMTYELWVYQMANDAHQQLPMEQRALGIAWKPGTHLLAFGAAYDEGYFTTRGEVDISKAKGIWGVDADTGESSELVAPQNGYTLRSPQWSREGRFLSFEEVWGYEGSGYFAYYDFDAQAYTSFEEAFGFYDWSPDSETIVHDTLTYSATGTERIYLRPRTGGESEQFSPDYELGYAFWPLYSPSGEQVAYLAEIGAVDSGMYTLFVQPVTGGEPRQIGVFEFGLYLNWLPDESGIILSAGPFGTRQVFEVTLADGAVRVLADGDSPVLAP